MTAGNIEPLEPSAWFDALERLLRRQRTSRDNDLFALLRHAYHLLQLTPCPLRSYVNAGADEATFERYMASAAGAQAALALVGPGMAFSISSTARDEFQARVWLTEHPGGAATTSRSLASALVGAWTKCLLDLRDRALRQDRDPGPHTGLCERRPMPIQH